MAGKQDPKRNFGAAGGGSAPAEKAEEENFKTGAVLLPAVPLSFGRHKLGANQADSMSSLMLKKTDSVCGATLMPCTGSRTATEEGKKADSVYGGLRPCASGRTLTGGEVKADSVSGGMWPCTGGHTPLSGGLSACSGILADKESKQKDALFAVKSKAEDTKGAAAAAEDAPAVDGGEGEDSEIKWVEMPEEHIHWILAQKRENHTVPRIEEYDLYRTEEDAKSTVFSQKNINEKREMFTRLHASLQASHDDFFEYQAWVREVFSTNGRVLIPEACNKDEVQKEINSAWAQFEEEYARDHPDDSDTDSQVEYAMVVDYSDKEGVPSN